MRCFVQYTGSGELGSIDAGKEAVLNVVGENRQDMEEQLI